MSIDKDNSEGGPFPGPPSRRPSVSRSLLNKAATGFMFWPLITLPMLMIASVVYGVVFRVVWELFKFSWSLFGWS